MADALGDLDERGGAPRAVCCRREQSVQLTELSQERCSRAVG